MADEFDSPPVSPLTSLQSTAVPSACISQYVYQMSKKSETYQNNIALLKELCQSHVEKNSSRLASVLKQLTFYQMDSSVFVWLLHMLKSEDCKVVRYAHYFILQVVEEDPQQALAAISLLEKESRSEHIGRRIFGLRTYASLCPGADATRQLIMLLSQELEKVAAISLDSKKKGMFSRKTTNTGGETKATLFYALLSAARIVPDLCRMGGLPISHICAGLSVDNAVAVRHAMALILDISDMDPQRVAFEMQQIDFKNINLTDTLAAVYYNQVCARLARCPKDKLDPAVANENYKSLVRQTGRSNVGTFIGAGHLLADLGFARLMQERSVEGKALVGVIMERLRTKILVSNSPAVQHAGCRLLRALAKSFALSQANGEIKPEEPSPITDIINTVLRDLRTSKNIYIRTQVLCVLIWNVSVRDWESVALSLRAEIVENHLAASLLEQVFTCLHERVKTNSAFAPFLLQCSKEWIAICPQRCDANAWVSAWRTLIKMPEIRRSVLEVILEVLGLGTSPLSVAFVGEIQRAVICAIPLDADLIFSQSSDDTEEIMYGLASHQAILLRLYHAATFAPQETRAVAVDSLGKLALKLDDDLRIEIYEFLFKLARAEGSGISASALPYVTLLDEYYSIMQQQALGSSDFHGALLNWRSKVSIILTQN